MSLSDVDNDTALTSSNTTDTIPTLSTSKTLADLTDSTEQFPEERWGYSWAKNSATSDLTFDPVPAYNATAVDKQKDSTTEGGSNYYTFTLGVRVSTDTAAETYSDQILFTLVGNPAPTAPLFFRTTYMQNFSASVCNSVKPPLPATTDLTSDNGGNYYDDGTYASRVPSTTAIDRRDGQVYTIRKLADGNCWMTENLRLGKLGAVTLDSTYSNLTEGRTFTLPAAATTAGAHWDNQDKYKFVFYRNSNPGAVNATVKPENVTPDGPSALYNWYTATAGARPAPEPSVSDPYAGDCNNDPTLADNCGSLMTATGGQAADSVCPKNWQLPINGGTGVNKSYGKLVYVYTGAASGSSADTGTSPEQAATNQTNIIKLLASPTSFIYSDYYYYGGTLNSRPVGHYWSSSVNSAAGSYSLVFNTDGTARHLDPQYYNYKGNAFAVRCVVQ